MSTAVHADLRSEFTPVPGPKRRLFRMPRANRSGNITGYLESLAHDYGDVVHIRLGNFEAYLLNHPDLIQDVLVTNSRSFMKGQGLQRAKRLLGEGLLTSEGEFHLKQRRLLQPVFLKNHIQRYAEAMSRHAVKTATRWQNGDTVDMAREIGRLTLAVVGETLFSADIEAQSSEIGAALDTSIELFDSLNSPLTPLFDLLPFGPSRRFQQARARLDAPILRIIEEHRSRPEQDTGDLLSLLLGARYEDGGRMSDCQVRDEAMTLFLAGHETTANALAWTWYLLAQHPDIEDRLHAEVDTILEGRVPEYGDLEKLAYTRQVVSESMRLYPPAWILGRTALEDYPVEHQSARHLIPKGALVLTSQWIMHHDARYWDEPQRFDPERWAPGAVSERPRFAYFPFGAGPRQCIGEGFAWMEAILLLAALTQRWQARLATTEPVTQRPGITLRPKGLTMQLERR